MSLLLFSGPGGPPLASLGTAYLVVEAAFGADVFTPPASTTWTQIDKVKGIVINRGRRSPHEPFPAGNASITLSNHGRRWDPTNTAGPWYGDLRPGLRFRIRETILGNTLFVGWADTWPMQWARSEGDVTIVAYDALRFLADAIHPPTSITFGENPASRIGRAILEGLGADAWISWYVTDIGVCTLQTAELSGGALQIAQIAAESEGGTLLCQRDGRLRFFNRHAAFTETRQSTPQLTFSPAGTPGTYPYSAPVVTWDRQQIINRAVISHRGSITHADVVDAPSKAIHGERARDRRDLEHDSITDSQAIAEMLVQAHADPAPKLTSLTVKSTNASDAGYLACAFLDLLDLVNVDWAPGNPVVGRNFQLATIQGYTLAADDTSIGATYTLSPASLQAATPPGDWLRTNSGHLANGSKKAAP